ncbi:hypothetical protein ALI144C_41670 [Actinosynnema sp. ALI-1.44]|uniref:DUF6294 family protein n=1 Tax=Actinosynnema sp. ALI-1.44 TaxID=1933779 RepID=UPI00097C170D|nr:DUF6294 family protein [Actinosynnema sp. ALI-1.44]ONI75243.1 hypothetical protein ALI144C_41670 [Actinosynnema sp. ALI-1.44]
MKRTIPFGLKAVVTTALAAVIGSVALTGPATAATPQAGAPAEVRPGAQALSWQSWVTSADWNVGDCTMFKGATWILYSDGTMTFDGTVTSSDDHDAFLFWIDVWDHNNAYLGRVANRYPDTPDHTVFAKNMPDSDLQYRWLAYGNFPTDWYPRMGRFQPHGSC